MSIRHFFMIRSRNSETRLSLVKELATPLPKATVRRLMRDRERTVRAAANYKLGSTVREPEIRRLVLQQLKHEYYPYMRASAAYALADDEISNPSIEETIRALVESVSCEHEPIVCFAGASSLALLLTNRFGVTDPTHVLCEKLVSLKITWDRFLLLTRNGAIQTASPEVRLRCVEALGFLGEPNDNEFLRSVCSDRDEVIRDSARVALNQLSLRKRRS